MDKNNATRQNAALTAIVQTMMAEHCGTLSQEQARAKFEWLAADGNPLGIAISNELSPEAIEPAEALLAAMRSADADPTLELSEREREILSRRDAKSDKAIAAELDLTTNGVRYHLRKLFSRLGATSRGEAVRRARELGLFPGGGVKSSHDNAGAHAREAQRPR